MSDVDTTGGHDTGEASGPVARPGRGPWWRSAVIYQVYIRSFADGNGDGLGDIAGLRQRLGHIASLGADAIWINPWYPSPMADAGYDVADYRAIEPRFGTLGEAEALLHEAHALGLRVLLDIVPNHCSDEHAWFRAAVAAGRGSAERARFVFRDGRGPDGSTPPNDWMSVFHGPAWTRVTEPDGTPGQWYLHLFDSKQPDWNWDDPEVRADFERTLRFWFDRGVDGFRIDVAHSLVKAEGLPDLGETIDFVPGEHPFWDRDEVHEVYRQWRAVADSYDEPRVFVAEAWVQPSARLARYLRPDELHTAFNFDYLRSPFTAGHLRAVIDETLANHESVGAPPTWVLSNHDVARHVSRLARPQEHVGHIQLAHLLDTESDLEVGERRSRAAVLLTLALPGGAYVYQGEELGLPEVEDLPLELKQDPAVIRSGGVDLGRDGCRVPLPWSGDGPPFGFSPNPDASPWLPQPASWVRYTVASEEADPTSMLWLYRAALGIRRDHAALGDGSLRWLDMPAGSIAFAREPGFVCVVNVDGAPVALPVGGTVLLASGALAADGRLPRHTAAWVQVGT